MAKNTGQPPDGSPLELSHLSPYSPVIINPNDKYMFNETKLLGCPLTLNRFYILARRGESAQDCDWYTPEFI